jgi:hypothetical protein
MKSAAAACLVVAAIVLAGCASSRSVLNSGITPGLGGKTILITDAAAVRDGKANRADWLQMVKGESDRGLRFAGVPAREFRSRLAAAAARYGFKVDRIEFLEQPRPTPLVVVQTSRYLAFARAVPAIERSLDPHRGRSDLRGWSFRAFYLEAVDEKGVPFLSVDDVEGADGVTGGQWARSDPLFPFPHG